MAAKKISSGFLFHIIITIIGIGAAFFVGWKLSGSGQGDVEKQLSELKTGIDANMKLSSANQKLSGTNKKGIESSLQKIKILNVSVSRELRATKAGIASAGEGMAYVNNVLGLKWVPRPGSRQRYCLTPYPLPWHYAQDFARKVGGNLVVIDDKAENEWITKTFGTSTEFWIGLTDEVDEGKWLWVNDSDLLYKNWATGEPDNYKKTQHHVIMNKQAAKGTQQPGKWNDVGCNEIRIGIIEVGR